MAQLATCHRDVRLDAPDTIVAAARRICPDLVIVGAEDLLVAGIASRLAEHGIACLGPSQVAARLEGSKTYAKELMERAQVRTPRWRSCGSVEEAHAAIAAFDGSVAVKADGLAAGCGAYVCRTSDAAHEAVDLLMRERRFGDAGARVVVEQLIAGSEVSVMALVDGERIVALPAARDYKRLGTGDEGPNTGGMGAWAPSLPHARVEELAAVSIAPIVRTLAAEGVAYRGIIYAGIMLTEDGPQVLEYNCRLGNP
jgi:phosphoribosylamine--glycine ligase